MEDPIARAMSVGGIADITTTGRKSGQARRTEIYFHHFDGRFFVTGREGRRDWVANLNRQPDFVLNLDGKVVADVPVTANHLHDPVERRDIIYRSLTESWGRDEATAGEELSDRVDNGILIEFTLKH